MATSALRQFAESHGFSGVVRVAVGAHVVQDFALGAADRSNDRSISSQTRFGVASVTKGLTALTIMALIEAGDLQLDMPVRAVLGADLALVDDRVTIEHLLAHRSGVGDYLDEDLPGDVDDHILGHRSAHTLKTPSDYLDLLAPYEQRSVPGEHFAYNNSGYVILSIIIERVTGSFHRSVQELVLDPAGMNSSGFFRTDSLPGDVAVSYLRDGRTNVFHLPVIGAGDGGVYLTVGDAMAFWQKVRTGAVVTLESVDLMTSIVSDRGDRPSYGLGFWIDHAGDHVWLEGMDAGVSCQTGYVTSHDMVYAVMANTSSGAWSVVREILSGSR